MARRKLSELEAGTATSNQTPQAVRGPNVLDNVRKGLGEIPGFAQGALNKARETTSQPLLRALAKMGFGPAQREMESVDAWRENHVPVPGEKAGEVAADFGMLLAPTPFGKAGTAKRILGAAAQGTAQHQAQNFAREGEINPGEAIGEMALSTAIPFAGQGIAKGSSALAPKIMDGITPKGMKGGPNPPDWAWALRNKLVPYFGGAKGISNTVSPRIEARDELQNQLLRESGSKVNVMDQIEKTLKGLRRSIGASTGDRIRNEQYENAVKYGDDALLTAKAQEVSGERARGLRKIADDAVGEAGFENAPAEAKNAAVFYRPYRENLEEALLQSMRPKDVAAMSKEVSRAAKRGGPLEIDLALKANEDQKARFGRYVGNKNTLSKLTPLSIAAEDMAKSGRKIGNYIDIGVAGGGVTSSLYGDNSAIPALGALGIIAARRGTVSPTGARFLYDLGRNANNKAVRMGGKLPLDLSRSLIFGRDGEE